MILNDRSSPKSKALLKSFLERLDVSSFQCEVCGCVDNTAYGLYGTTIQRRSYDWSYAPERKDLNVCSACGPCRFVSGTTAVKIRNDVNCRGSWHGFWSRSFLPLGNYTTNHEGSLVNKETMKPPAFHEYIPAEQVTIPPSSHEMEMARMGIKDRPYYYQAYSDPSHITKMEGIGSKKVVATETQSSPLVAAIRAAFMADRRLFAEATTSMKEVDGKLQYRFIFHGETVFELLKVPVHLVTVRGSDFIREINPDTQSPFPVVAKQGVVELVEERTIPDLHGYIVSREGQGTDQAKIYRKDNGEILLTINHY